MYVVSLAHLPSTTVVNRNDVDGTVAQVACPEIVSQYNRYMEGVDLSDQLKACYGVD